MRRIRSCLFAPAVACFIALLSAESAPGKTLEIGDRAPDFKLPGVDGKSYSLKDFEKAKILCMLFTCNHCPTAQAYEGRIKKLVSDYRDKGVALVAISPNDPEAVRLNELGYTDLSDSFEEMKIRAEHRKFNFPYLYDGETQEVSRAYGPAATPHVFVFDEERKLRYVGRIDDSERERNVKTHDLRNTLDALLEGRPVPVEKTRTFGCSVKWSSKRDSVKRSRTSPKPEDIKLEPIGPEALKKVITGKSKSLKLVNVWATWCGPCVAEFPELINLHHMYGRRAFELITLSGDFPDQKDKVLSFLRKKEAVTKNYLFNQADREALFEAVDDKWVGALPHTILVSPEGKIVYRHTGEIKFLELRREIVKQLARIHGR